MMKHLEWYHSLNKPAINPPDWLFGPVWTILYILMGISLFLYIKTPSTINKRAGIIVFIIQLILNILWTPVFFTFRQIEPAAVICTLLVILTLITISIFYRVSKPAAYMLIPYFLWLCLAAYLNIEIVRLNT